MYVSAAKDKRIVAALVFLGAALAVRFAIEGIWLLPSPIADSAFFLTASVNYCRADFLGTTTYPIDPTGQARMIWHGFVSPMFFGTLNRGCRASGYYLLLWAVKAATTLAIVYLARRRGWSVLPLCGLAAFALAAQTATGFRPEGVAILLIVLLELAVEGGRHVLLGALMAALLCTQPTVAGMHGLVMLLVRPKLGKHWLAIGIGYGTAVTILLALYPFPAVDLISGILLQAKHLVGRSDGSVVSYYLLQPLLPAWSLLLIAAGFTVARRKSLLVCILPALWFFGPRVPPVYYNLLPICLLLMIIAVSMAPELVSNALGGAALAVAVLGLGMSSARDLLTVYRYGDTFKATSERVAGLSTGHVIFGSLPSFLALTNPALRITDPTAPPPENGAADRSMINLFAVSGRPYSPCPAERPASVNLALGQFTLFNTNSGWMVYVCHEKR